MKKTLTLLLALFAIGVTSSVRAEEVFEFKPIGQQTVPTVTVSPFKTGEQTIDITLQSNGYVYASIKHKNGETQKIKTNLKQITVTCPAEQSTCTERTWMISGNRADQYGNYTVQLQKPLAVGDVVTLSFADDGHFYLGKLVFEDEKTQNTRLQAEKSQEQEEEKKRDNELRKQLEENMLKQIREEDHKTWHQRLSESIQDQWWNFKGLFQ
ncbi:hypothetical protein [Streptococcus pyogenes]|uniref:hypothetical protein n=1 Tax=Streptococcus pyogenes TaxID=1314 RepID=UPI000E08AF11|nr:hypothetical protein [Streptococcus pyogenes]SUO63809.1 phage protein [Streptococcus pyogenes]VGQ75116.1 phage protein [Streptococcus pyogenes]VGQ78783.1 phage protein [Streptococcus pyogenes]VGU43317.1 phage protein [Streptococcus pyogenes]VGV47593.1 phage protein [Streptococcus pyogenes]